MKLHYSKILLFSLLLNILVLPSYVHNKNKSYITPRHKPTPISRVLSECDLYISSCDNDPDMKSVKENFDRQTSQRFEEYEKRMIKNRKRCKEQCDKDIQEIIVKDKVEKSLSEKVEKGCLKCGCGLGGVAAGVGIIGPVAVKGLENAALLAAAQKGIEAGIAKAIEELGKIAELSVHSLIKWHGLVTPTTYNKPMALISIVNQEYFKCMEPGNTIDTLFCKATKAMGEEPNVNPVKVISQEAAKAAAAADKAAKAVEEAQIGEVTTVSSNAYTAIGYSVLAILIIVLVLIIIYLVLRYRRKKKMNKKSQYTKLLNQ
ncbi:hypothetical protein PFHG_04341 [Plasmodium falciparum HB3]|uniref:Rifin n=1 Tax=Plasmodium falciparum (isolate HB3) TaxID=137071 RepID=A0A0L7KH14_PLAFX|nr:hypothetical protein PFHG_04341 [Plasmodium falciparum HB3]